MFYIGLLLALVASFHVANCDVAAIAAPHIRDAIWSGQGCPSSRSLRLFAEAHRLIAEMPKFVVVAGDLQLDFISCSLVVTMDQAIAGYRLGIRSVGLEGYLMTNGTISMGTANRVTWINAPLPAVSINQPPRRVIPGTEAQLQRFRQTVAVPPEFASRCFTVDGGVMNQLNVAWLVEFIPEEEGSYGAFLGMADSPVTGTIEFEWIPCEGPAVEIETGVDEPQQPEPTSPTSTSEG